MGSFRTNKLKYEDLLQKFQFLYEICIRVHWIMGEKRRIVPQLGIEILKKKNFDTVNHYFSPYTFSVCH